MVDNKSTALGARVKKALADNDRNVKWLSRTTGISYTTLRNRIAQPGTFQFEELEQVAEALNLSVEWLQTGYEVAA